MQIELEVGMLRWMKWLCSMSERFLASSQVRRQDEHALAEMFCVHVHAFFVLSDSLFKSLETYMLDYYMLHYLHITCLMHQAWVFHLVQADRHRFSANMVL